MNQCTGSLYLIAVVFQMSAIHRYGIRLLAVIYSCLFTSSSEAGIDIQVKSVGIEDYHAEMADIKLAKGEE